MEGSRTLKGNALIILSTGKIAVDSDIIATRDLLRPKVSCMKLIRQQQ